jgi:hypothetical protein
MNQLFELPEYDYAFQDFYRTAVYELMRRKDPLLSKMPAAYADHIPTVQNTMPSGEVVEIRLLEFAMRFATPFDDAISGRTEGVIEAINDAAENGLKTLMPQIFAQLGRLSSAAETAIDAKGQPLTTALILQSLEKMEMDFDKDGSPIIGMVVGPEMYEQMRGLLPLTREEQQAFDDLFSRKKQEFDARQRRRKLS